MSRIRRLAVEVPVDVVTHEQWGALVDQIAEIAFDWEPDDRDGWDVNVYGTVVSNEDPDDENCTCGTILSPCGWCGDWRCYRCDPEGTSYCDIKEAT